MSDSEQHLEPQGVPDSPSEPSVGVDSSSEATTPTPEQPLVPVQLVPDHLLAKHGVSSDGAREAQPARAQEFLHALDTAKQDRMSSKERRILRARNEERKKHRVRRQRIHRSLDKVGTFVRNGLLFAVCAAPLAVGSVHLYALAPLAVLSLILLVLTGLSAWIRNAPVRIGWTGFALLALALWSWIQTIPLPHSLLATLSPQGAEWLTFALGSLVPPTPTSSPISLSPRFGLLNALALTSVLGVYLSSINVPRERETWVRNLWCFPVLGVLLVVIGVAQRALNSPQRLFFYTPVDQSTPPLFASTFVNPNHLGVLLAACALVSLGLAFSYKKELDLRSMASLGTVATGAGVLASCSFSAWVAFLFGLLALFLLLVRHRATRDVSTTWATVAGVSLLGVVSYCAWLWGGPYTNVLRGLQKLPPLDPIPTLAAGWDAVFVSPGVGLGAGAFADVAKMLPTPIQTSSHFVSNTALQTLMDYGIPVGLFVLGSLFWAVGRLVTWRRWKPKDVPILVGCCAALLCLVLASMTGSSLQILGVALPGVFLLSLAQQRNALYEGSDTAPTPSPTQTRWVPFIIPALLAVLAFSSVSDLFQEEPAAETPSAKLQHKLSQRPLHARSHLEGALDYAVAQDHPQVLAALERAERFNPHDPAPLLVKARWLLARGDREGAFAYFARAAKVAPHLPVEGRATIAHDVARFLPTPETIIQALGTDPHLWQPALESALSARPAQEVLALCSHLRTLSDPHLKYLGTSTCALVHWNEANVVQARDLAESVQDSPHVQDGLYVLLGRIYAQYDDPRKAIEVLERGAKQFPRSAPILLELLETLLHHIPSDATERDRHIARMRMTVNNLRPLVLRTEQHHGRFFFLTAQLLAQRGQNVLAIRDLQRSIQASPEPPEPYLTLIALLKKERRLEDLNAVYRDFTTRFPKHPSTPQMRSVLDGKK